MQRRCVVKEWVCAKQEIVKHSWYEWKGGEVFFNKINFNVAIVLGQKSEHNEMLKLKTIKKESELRPD